VFASLLTFVFPLGFMAYYPAHHFLQLAPRSFPIYFPFLSPLVAVLTLLIALLFWSLGLQHYQSTGT
jgi:ABC-2 type transport system permease protein